MLQPGRLIVLAGTLILFSCNSFDGNTSAIRDFKRSIRPALEKIVEKGIVAHFDSSLSSKISNIELAFLSKSEHPVLRASALLEMLRRKSFNHNDVIISHLDDTAIVSYDLGEWGIFYLKLADCILSEATWNSEEDKRKIVDRVITKHNNLRSAYTIISKIEADEKYYSYIRIMATRSEYDDYKYGATRVDEIEYALFGLAGFKKKEDIAFIKQRLLDLNWEIGKTSFNLMKKFPDTTYLGVYEKFYRRAYQTICRKRDYDRAASFIKSVATYKSDRSAAILNLILNNKPSVYCWPDSSYLRNVLVEAIWDNPCAAYINLRKQTQKAGEEYENEKIDPLKLEPNADNTPGQTIWWF